MTDRLPFLRSGLPESYAFSVTQQPHVAKLDQNEAPIDVPDEVKRALLDDLAAQPWNRYVQPAQYAEAKSALAAEHGLDPDRVALTVGADQAIEAAFVVAGGPGRRARWFEPTYPYVAQASRRTHTAGESIVGEPSVDALLADPAPELAVLVSPNNPTGATVGFLCGHPDVIAVVENMFTAPYHVDAFQLTVARNYPLLRPHVEAAAKLVVAGNVGGLPGLEDFLRVTIGTPEHNDLFITSLRGAVSSVPA